MIVYIIVYILDIKLREDCIHYIYILDIKLRDDCLYLRYKTQGGLYTL